MERRAREGRKSFEVEAWEESRKVREGRVVRALLSMPSKMDVRVALGGSWRVEERRRKEGRG